MSAPPVDKPKRPRAPRELGDAGKELWRRIWADLPDEAEFDEREIVVLETACRQADTIAQLEASIAKRGLEVRGSTGQTRMNPAVTELRQCRLAFARLLGTIGIPDDDDLKRETHRSEQARRAANASWAGHRGRRHGTA